MSETENYNEPKNLLAVFSCRIAIKYVRQRIVNKKNWAMHLTADLLDREVESSL